MDAGVGTRVDTTERRTPEQIVIAKAAKHWVQQLGRTLKSCRLYASTNPVVERARADLTEELKRLLDPHGPLTLRIASDDILLDDDSLYPARSREDNLALPFFRDGIRGITFSPGIELAEVNVLIDSLLQVTGPVASDDDLVTLLWKTQLNHVEIECVPPDAEADGPEFSAVGESRPGGRGSGAGTGTGGGSGSGGGGGGGGRGGFGGTGADAPAPHGAFMRPGGGRADGAPVGAERAAEGMPWPGLSSTLELAIPQAAAPATGEPETTTGRSDDWQVDPATVEAEATFEELDLAAAPGLDAFLGRLDAERGATGVTIATDLARAYLAASDRATDRTVAERFLTRVVRQAAAEVAWEQAGAALTLLKQSVAPEWTIDTLAEDLCHPRLLAPTMSNLEDMDLEQVGALIAFARQLDDWSIDLLGHVLAEATASRHRDRLVAAIAEECEGCPERLAAWLRDPRWTVVRDTVHVLGKIGGTGVAPLLEPLATHEVKDVRDEVLAALERVPLIEAKPVLMAFLDDVDTKEFCTIVARLGRMRDAEVGHLMVAYLTHPQFEQQAQEERQAVYAAVVTAGGDDVLSKLEAELRAARGSSKALEQHREDVANCIVQIGTPSAKQVLRRGVQSQRPAIRQVCQAALAKFGGS